jgi:hypothetical protein
LCNLPKCNAYLTSDFINFLLFFFKHFSFLLLPDFVLLLLERETEIFVFNYFSFCCAGKDNYWVHYFLSSEWFSYTLPTTTVKLSFLVSYTWFFFYSCFGITFYNHFTSFRDWNWKVLIWVSLAFLFHLIFSNYSS